MCIPFKYIFQAEGAFFSILIVFTSFQLYFKCSPLLPLPVFLSFAISSSVSLCSFYRLGFKFPIFFFHSFSGNSPLCNFFDISKKVAFRFSSLFSYCIFLFPTLLYSQYGNSKFTFIYSLPFILSPMFSVVTFQSSA